MAAMNTLPVPEPDFVLRYNLKDITHDITAYATSITFTDKLSGESDELEVELEDSEQRWRDAWYPGMGDTLSLQLGFKGKPLTDCGGFSIDEIELSGPPDSVSIRGRSAPVTRAMRTRSNRGFENTTLAAIAGRIARKHKLKLEGQIEPLTLERITQYGESDLAFLKRLAQDYGYMVKVTPQKLIFSHLGKLRDAPVIRTITPQDISRWTLRDTLHEVYKGGKNKHQNSQTRTLVTYKADGSQDTRQEKRKQVQVPFRLPDESAGADTLNTYERASNPAESHAKGKAKLDSKNEYKHAGTLSLGDGDLSLRAGASVTLSGFGQSDGKWLVISARHSLTRSSGLTTDIDIARGLKRKATGSTKKQTRTLTVFKADGTTEQIKADKKGGGLMNSGVIFATGTVSAIDPKTVRARVRLPDHDNLRTWWLDVMQNNTYKNKDYCMPDVGEQVKVLMTPDGVEGVILGAVYSSKDTPVISDPDKRRTDFADGTFVEYDRKNNAMAIGGAIKTLTITTHSDITLQTDTQVTVIAQNRATVKTQDALIDAANSATIKTQKATVNSPETEITGNTTIKKNLLVKGSITGQGGMAISGGKGGAAATITGSLSATGDVSAGGTSLKRHEHPKGHNGAPTGPPSS